MPLAEGESTPELLTELAQYRLIQQHPGRDRRVRSGGPVLFNTPARI